MQLKIKKLHPDAIMPKYQSAGAACFDLHAIHSGHIYARDALTFKTGLAFEVPPGWCLKIYSRSGHAFSHGVRLGNAVGVLDADFRGELQLRISNDRDAFYVVKAGDRIAQAMLEPAQQVELIEVDELSETARGDGGFGSTGK